MSTLAAKARSGETETTPPTGDLGGIIGSRSPRDVLLVALPSKHAEARSDGPARSGRERDISAIVLVQDVNLGAPYCDAIVALHGDRLIAQSPPDQIQIPQARIYDEVSSSRSTARAP